jgi:hypothetical protein
MAAASVRRGSDLLTFRAKRLLIKTAQINRARESNHDAVCCGQVSPVLADTVAKSKIERDKKFRES